MYHINNATGEVSLCRAKRGKCPFGEAAHHAKELDARRAYEESQKPLYDESKCITHAMELSAQTKELLEKLSSADYTPFIVGGSVRDSLLSGATPKDIDIEVFGVSSMDELERKLNSFGYKVDAVGKSFGVLKIMFRSGEDIDISLPRRDSKVSSGHRGFQVVVDSSLTLDEAAGRRDFTVNALYYDEKAGKLIDSFGGIKDYKSGYLRHINEHFAEDPLRVIRGAQFASRFGLKLHPSTIKLCQNLRSEAKSIATERLQTEFEKMFAKGDSRFGLKALKATEWAKELELHTVKDESGEAGHRAKERAEDSGEDKAIYVVANWLKDIEDRNKRSAANMMLVQTKRQSKAINLANVTLPSDLSSKEMNRWARAISKERLTPKDVWLAYGDEALKQAAEKAGVFEGGRQDMLTGGEIVELAGRKPGKWVSEVTRDFAKAQDEELFSDKASAIDWLKSYMASR